MNRKKIKSRGQTVLDRCALAVDIWMSHIHPLVVNSPICPNPYTDPGTITDQAQTEKALGIGYNERKAAAEPKQRGQIR